MVPADVCEDVVAAEVDERSQVPRHQDDGRKRRGVWPDSRREFRAEGRKVAEE